MNFLLLESLQKQQPIKIFYVDRHQKVSERIIRVDHVGDKHIRAYCYWRKAIRIFRKDNLLSAGPIKRKVGA
jgi:predicted DNA-binding transcriptional regulator YafY